MGLSGGLQESLSQQPLGREVVVAGPFPDTPAPPFCLVADIKAQLPDVFAELAVVFKQTDAMAELCKDP